jgi:serine/threonine protein kinase
VPQDRCPVCHTTWPEPVFSHCPGCKADIPSYFQNTLPEGTVLHGGKYRLNSVLGKGGFGITYRAEHRLLNQAVAIKEFFPQRCMERNPDGSVQIQPFWSGVVESSRRRFLEEGRMLYQLREPGAIRCQDLFEENGTAYLVMEYLQGQTLEQLLLRSPDHRLPPEQTGQIFKQLLTALRSLHAQEILHLDIKPDNIWIRENGEALLLDFGSSLRGLANAVPQVCTPAYAPVELISLDFPTGPWTDIFQLGMVFYVVLLGQMPPTALERLKGRELNFAQLSSEQQALLPTPWRTVLESALGLLPSERPQNVADWLIKIQNPAPAKHSAVQATSSPLPQMVLHPIESKGLLCLALSPDGREAFVGGQDQRVKRWELATGRLLQVLSGPQAPLLSLACSDTGQIAAGDSAHELHLWEQPGQPEPSWRFKPDAHQDRITALCFAHEGKMLLSGGADKTLICWDSQSLTPLWSQSHFSHWIQALANKGKLLLVGCSNGQIQLLDLESGKLHKTLSGHSSGITALRFVPGKAEAISSSWDKTLRHWDLRTGQTIQIFQGHSLDVTSLDLSPDGSWLISGSWDRSLKSWDLNGNCTAHLQAHSDYVTDVAVIPSHQPGQKHCLSISKDGTLIRWDLHKGEWVYKACSQADGVYTTLGRQGALQASDYQAAARVIRTLENQQTQPLSPAHYQAACQLGMDSETASET